MYPKNEPMEKIKLIVTADDYGVIPEIDKATISAIKNGIVNCISFITNFSHAKKAFRNLVKELKAANLLDKVAVGLHLNITMGPPLLHPSKVKSLVSSTNNFYTFRTYQKSPDLDRFDIQEIKNEAISQVQQFINISREICQEENIDFIPIDHITSHFNLFHTVPDLADILVELCNLFKQFGTKPSLAIPIRRPLPIMVEYEGFPFGLGPKVKEVSKESIDYMLFKNFSIGALYYRSKWLKKDKLRDLILSKFTPNKVRMPHAMFLSFYGTAHSFENKIDQFIAMLGDLRKAAVKDGIIKEGDTFFIEIVHHLGNRTTVARRKEIKITGFDKRYLRKYRPNEVEITESDRYSDLLRIGGISHGKFSDIPKI